MKSIGLMSFLVAAAMAGAVSAGSASDSEASEESKPGETVASFDAEAGETLYMKNCRACHGRNAKGVSSYPNLREHPAAYLVERLETYRAGEKIGPNTMLMAPQAMKLSDEDIGDVVKFITSIED